MLNNTRYKLLFTFIFAFLFTNSSILFAQGNLNDGINAVKNGDFVKAAEILKSVVAKDNSYDANYYYSHALFKTGSLADADKYAKNAISIDNERPEAYSVLGEIYSFQKKYSEAESSFETAKKYLPLNKTKEDLEPAEINTIIVVLSREADNFIAEGKVDKAITSLSMAKTYDNNNPILLVGIGDAYRTRGSFDLAKTNYNSALSAKSNYAPAFYGLGKVAFIQKKYNDAIDYFTKAINADQNYSEAYFERGLILYLSEKFDPALDDFKKYSDLKPGSLQGKIYYAKTLYAKGQLDDAMKLLDEALTVEPNSSEANKYKAYIYVEKKDYSTALSYFGKVDEKDYNSEDYTKLAKIYVDQKDFNKAYDYYKKSLAKDSTDENTYFEYGKAQFNNQEYDGSLVNFNKAIALNINNVGVYVYKGIALYYKSDYENAIPQFQKCLDTNPSASISGICYLWIGNCYAAEGKRSDAITAYKKCLELDSNNQDAKDQIQKLGGQ
jgi:tetratricopeptide (TPR) repeat protein